MRAIITGAMLALTITTALADVIKSDCKGGYLSFNPYFPREVVGDKPRPMEGVKLEIDLTKKTIVRWMDAAGLGVGINLPGSRRSDPMAVYRITRIDNTVIEFTDAHPKVHFDINSGTIDRTNGAFHSEAKRVDDGSKGMLAGEYFGEENLVCTGFAKTAPQPNSKGKGQ
jgi:hypothetical protein